MKTVVSISGGKSSAMCATLEPEADLVFALVTTDDKNCLFPDNKLRQKISDRIGKEFIGTLEDDLIIYTILDLEQYLGREINIVSGISFDEVIKGKQTRLPSWARRYCTTKMKIEPIFYWWAEKYNMQPVKMPIGYRQGEENRMLKMIEKSNENGFSIFKGTFEKHKNGAYKGKNKWVETPWRMPTFPLIDNFIDKVDVHNFWKNKPVRFAEYNNCIGCFHRKAAFLKEMSKKHPTKFEWFVNAETIGKGTFQKDISYQKIKNMNFTLSMKFHDDEGCDSGFCGF